MFSLVLLEASLPHLAMDMFSPETSEVFNTLISDAWQQVELNEITADWMACLGMTQNTSDELQHYPSVAGRDPK